MIGFGQALGEAPADQAAQQGANPMEGYTLENIAEHPMHQQFVQGGIQIMTDDKFIPRAREILEATPSVEEGLARMVLAIVTRIYDGAAESGVDVPFEIVLVAGVRILETAIEFVEVAGLGEVTDDQAESAFYIGADMFRGHLEGLGKIDPAMHAETLEEVRAAFGDEPINRVQDMLSASQQAQIAKMAPSMAGGEV